MKKVYEEILEEREVGVESINLFNNPARSNQNDSPSFSSSSSLKSIINEIQEEQSISSYISNNVLYTSNTIVSNTKEKEDIPYDSPSIYVPVNQSKELLERITLSGISQDYVMWVVSTIYLSRITNKTYSKDSYVELQAKFMKSMVTLNRKWTYRAILDLLLECGVIETDNHYIVEHKSKGYRLSEQYRNMDFKKTRITDERLINKIKTFKNKRKNEMGKQYEKICDTMDYVFSVDRAKALKYINQTYPVGTQEYQTRLESIEMIEGNIFIIPDKRTGRLYHNLSNIPSDLRKFISFDGKAIGQVDIVNSQPLFFYTSLLKSGADEGELVRLKDIVANGRFYEFIMELVGEVNRDVAKQNIFKDILFGYNTTNTIYTKAFRTAFPSISGIIFKLKEKDHSALAIAMQREESKFIYHCVDRIVLDKLSTIHDSIVGEVKDLEYIRMVMGDEFYDRYGFYPKLVTKAF